MKSKEEILEKHLNFKMLNIQDVYNAMEEYANQFKQPEKIHMNDRLAQFCTDVWEVYCNMQTDVKDKVINEFIDYWTEISPNGKKMRFEKEKVFDIKKRLERWIRNQKTFNNGKSVTETRFEQHSSGFDKMFNSTTNP